MKKITLFSISIVFILFSCSKSSTENPETESETPDNEEPTAEENVYFTINVAEDYFNSESEGWIVSHDVNNGNILNYSRLENGSKITFKKPTSSTMAEHHISLIKISNYNGNTYHQITSFVFVRPDVVWQLESTHQNYINPRGDIIGEITINANDLAFPVSWSISNKHGATLSGGSSAVTRNNLTSIFFENIPLFEENRYLFSTYDIYGEVRYLFMDNLEQGGNVTFDRTDLKHFDKTILAPVPEGGEYFAFVYGFEENQDFKEGGGYILAAYDPSYNDKIVTNNINLGYLDAFDKYITTFKYSKDRFNFSYKKYVDPPLGIPMGSMGDWNVEISDDSVDNFIYSGVSPNLFTRQLHYWKASSGTRNVDYVETSWSIHQGKFYYTFNFKLPEEILTTYPQMDVDGLNYQNSVFHVNEYDYSQFIDAIFVEPNPDLIRNDFFYRIDSE